MDQSKDTESREQDADWGIAYGALILETFDSDKAILLLKLLEKPECLQKALTCFVGEC